MEPIERARAVAATKEIGAEFGLAIDDAVVLSNSNKVILHLSPCEVAARVAPAAAQNAAFEVELAQRLIELDSPVSAFDPRVGPVISERDEFVVTLWTYYDPAAGEPITPAAYADALERLHAGMRKVDIAAPRFTDRVAEALQLVADREQTPELGDDDRQFLGDTLREVSRKIEERKPAEQLLHGEPHPGNLLATTSGPVFIDFETCCRGPVEFDLAHAPEEVAEHYPDLDRELLKDCRILMQALIIMWRWDRDDQFPNGRQLGIDQTASLRAQLGA